MVIVASRPGPRRKAIAAGGYRLIQAINCNADGGTGGPNPPHMPDAGRLTARTDAGSVWTALHRTFMHCPCATPGFHRFQAVRKRLSCQVFSAACSLLYFRAVRQRRAAKPRIFPSHGRPQGGANHARDARLFFAPESGIRMRAVRISAAWRPKSTTHVAGGHTTLHLVRRISNSFCASTPLAIGNGWLFGGSWDPAGAALRGRSTRRVGPPRLVLPRHILLARPFSSLELFATSDPQGTGCLFSPNLLGEISSRNSRACASRRHDGRPYYGGLTARPMRATAVRRRAPPVPPLGKPPTSLSAGQCAATPPWFFA